jgi:hypothetical protein
MKVDDIALRRGYLSALKLLALLSLHLRPNIRGRITPFTKAIQDEFLQASTLIPGFRWTRTNDLFVIWIDRRPDSSE